MTQVMLARDLLYIEEKTANKLITELHDISKMIGGYIRYRSQHIT
ncbi:four helix bundle protein [Photobacterium damselae]